MTKPTAERGRISMEDRMLIDPRHGDIEDDAASPGQRSLLAIAGSLLVEISLPKLLFAWTVLLLLPAVLLGLAPLLASAWFSTLSEQLATLTEIGTALALLAIVALGWIGWRPLFRIAEISFWSLNALAVQPGEMLKDPALEARARNLSAELRCLVCQNECQAGRRGHGLAR